MEYRTVKVETGIIANIKKKFPGTSLNKSLKAMLIHSGDYEAPDEDPKDTTAEIIDGLKFYLNSRLKAYSEKMEERFILIEEELKR